MLLGKWQHEMQGKSKLATSSALGDLDAEQQGAFDTIRNALSTGADPVVLTGPAGGGKTRVLSLLVNQSAAPTLRIVRIVEADKISPKVAAQIEKVAFQEAAKEENSDKAVVIAVDDAHAASAALLQSVARIAGADQSSRRVARLLLAGRPELWERLTAGHFAPPGRLVVRVHLPAREMQKPEDADVVAQQALPKQRERNPLIADDYDPASIVWPSVRESLDDTLNATPDRKFDAAHSAVGRRTFLLETLRAKISLRSAPALPNASPSRLGLASLFLAMLALIVAGGVLSVATMFELPLERLEQPTREQAKQLREVTHTLLSELAFLLPTLPQVSAPVEPGRDNLLGPEKPTLPPADGAPSGPAAAPKQTAVASSLQERPPNRATSRLPIPYVPEPKDRISEPPTAEQVLPLSSDGEPSSQAASSTSNPATPAHQNSSEPMPPAAPNIGSSRPQSVESAATLPAPAIPLAPEASAPAQASAFRLGQDTTEAVKPQLPEPEMALLGPSDHPGPEPSSPRPSDPTAQLGKQPSNASVARTSEPDAGATTLPNAPASMPVFPSPAPTAGNQVPITPQPIVDQPVTPATSSVVSLLMKRADERLALGDISAARLLYERAADFGDARAARLVAQTYDASALPEPVRFFSNPAASVLWYRRAIKLGDPVSADRLKMMGIAP